MNRHHLALRPALSLGIVMALHIEAARAAATSTRTCRVCGAPTPSAVACDGCWATAAGEG